MMMHDTNGWIQTVAEYLTTKELAELLRIKERKVYDLAASGKVPCSRATGKLLFPRVEIDRWLAENRTGPQVRARADLPGVFLGSHDPLLEWALRECRSGLATFFDSSMDGLDRFGKHEGIATGLHIYDAETGTWNTPAVSTRFSEDPVVLAGWSTRRRGLILRESLKSKIRNLGDLRGYTIAPRQPEAGAQHLFLSLLREEGVPVEELTMTDPARTEADAALAVRQGKADAAFGLETFAVQFRLPFVPLVEEEFDLLVDRRAWFEPPMQALFDFCGSKDFQERVKDFAGYDVTRLGTIKFNGA